VEKTLEMTGTDRFLAGEVVIYQLPITGTERTGITVRTLTT
jgi:hypothetical protein